MLDNCANRNGVLVEGEDEEDVNEGMTAEKKEINEESDKIEGAVRTILHLYHFILIELPLKKSFQYHRLLLAKGYGTKYDF